jgi:hypothetical protein
MEHMESSLPAYEVTPALGGDPQIVHDGEVTWNLGETGLAFADNSIFEFKNSHRHYDATFEWMDLEKFMDIQYDIYHQNAVLANERKSQFMQRETILTKKEYWTLTVDRKHVQDLIDLIKSGKVFDALVIEMSKDGKVLDFQEGRHRAIALKSMGKTKVPVWVVQKRF